ncbi:thiol-disulfide oxidoreductase DCC family protein [Tropicimonas sp. S265A]|uniref:thiol-disulfide oxidoreductase DCC family protein n=1 Tax=Tropicimonas sp. S265A TaxID=3415134 RepID=UPI003C7D5E9E
MTEQTKAAADIAVLYNASCPVCRSEIAHYEAYASTRNLPLRFEDLGDTDLSAWGLTADQAARRLHVLHDGEVLSGLPAFRVLWAQMPRYRWLSRVTGWPVIRPAAAAVYDHVLAPLLYHWHRNRYAGAEKTGKARRAP